MLLLGELNGARDDVESWRRRILARRALAKDNEHTRLSPLEVAKH
jgi:hypothetical protein